MIIRSMGGRGWVSRWGGAGGTMGTRGAERPRTRGREGEVIDGRAQELGKTEGEAGQGQRGQKRERGE